MTQLSQIIKKYFWVAACIALFIFETYLIGQQTQTYQVINSVPDEFVFFQTAQELSTHLYHLDFQKVITFGMPADYGFMFWLLSAILILILHFSFAIKMLILRIIFLGFKYLALVFFYKAVKTRSNSFNANLFVLLFLTTPGLYFYGKIFSLEYLLTAIVALAVYFLAKDKNDLRKYFMISTILIIQGIFIKYALLPVLGIPIIYMLFNWKKLSLKTLLITSAGTGLIAILNLPFLFSNQSQEILTKIGQNSGHFQFTLEQLKKWFFLDSHTWDQITIGGWYIDFFYILPFLFIWFVGNIVYKTLPKHSALGIATFIIGFVYASLISFVNPTYYWYLFIPYLVLMAGLCMTMPDQKHLRIIVAVVTLISVATGIPRIIDRINHKMTINDMLSQSDVDSNTLSQLVGSRCSSPTTVITDTIVALDPESLPSVRINPLIYAVWDNKHISSEILAATSFILINRPLINSAQETLNQVHPKDMIIDTDNKRLVYKHGEKNHSFSLIQSTKYLDIYFQPTIDCQ